MKNEIMLKLSTNIDRNVLLAFNITNSSKFFGESDPRRELLIIPAKLKSLSTWAELQTTTLEFMKIFFDIRESVKHFYVFGWINKKTINFIGNAVCLFVLRFKD